MITSIKDAKKVLKTVFNRKRAEANIFKKIKATTHEVYVFQLKGKRYVLRIAIKDSPKFYTELWALKNKEKLGIPSPKLVKWDDTKNVINYRWTIEEYIEGEHVPENDPIKLIQIYNQLSEKELKNIHKRKIKGFGQLNEKGKGEYKTLKEFLNGKFQKAFPKLEKIKILSQSELNQISQIHKESINQIKVKNARLILGDLHPKNFFIKNDQFTSFVDLKSIMGGDPLWEYGLISYYIGTEIWPKYIKKTKSDYRQYYYYLVNITLNKLWFCYKMNYPISK